jgi:hypothetical protein
MKHRNLRGNDLHAPSSELIENNTGSTIPVFKAVKFNGMGTLYPQVVLANSNVDIIRGITQADVLTGTTSYITSMGFLNNVNTVAWPVNTVLYADGSGNITNSPNNLPVATVLKQDAALGIIYVNTSGIVKADLDALTFPDPLSLELAWDINNPSFYTEPTYDMSGKITASDVWESNAKVLHIFNKTFTYTGPNLTNVLITRMYDGKSLEKEIVYDMGGKIINVTRTYTP